MRKMLALCLCAAMLLTYLPAAGAEESVGTIDITSHTDGQRVDCNSPLTVAWEPVPGAVEYALSIRYEQNSDSYPIYGIAGTTYTIDSMFLNDRTNFQEEHGYRDDFEITLEAFDGSGTLIARQRILLDTVDMRGQAAVEPAEESEEEPTEEPTEEPAEECRLGFYRGLEQVEWYGDEFTCQHLYLCLLDEENQVVDRRVIARWDINFDEGQKKPHIDVDVWKLETGIYFVETSYWGGYSDAPASFEEYSVLKCGDGSIDLLCSAYGSMMGGGGAYTIDFTAPDRGRKTSWEEVLWDDFSGEETNRYLNDFFSGYGLSFARKDITFECIDNSRATEYTQELRCTLPAEKLAYAFDGSQFYSLPELGSGEGPVPPVTAGPQPTHQRSGGTQQGGGEQRGYTTGEVFIRKGPGRDYGAVTTVPSGRSVEYLGESAYDERPVLWHHIRYSGKEGWASSKFVTVDDRVVNIVTGPAPAPTATPTATPTPTPTPAPTPVYDPQAPSVGSYSGKFRVGVSTYRADQDVDAGGDMAVDGALVTAWHSHEGASGAWIQLDIVPDDRLSRYNVGGVRVAPGHWKDNETFWNGAAPAEVSVYCDGAYICGAELRREKDFQTIWFPDVVTCSSVRLVVDSAYVGYSLDKRRDGDVDVCVTELELLGPEGRTVAKGAFDDWGASVRAAVKAGTEGNLTLEKGMKGADVMALQLILRDGFGLELGLVDGSFGNATAAAVDELAGIMSREVSDARPMQAGVADQAYWQNIVDYVDGLDEGE